MAHFVKAALLLLSVFVAPASAGESSVSSAAPSFAAMHHDGPEPVASPADGEDILRWVAPLVPRRTLGRASEAGPAPLRFPPLHHGEAHPLYRRGTRIPLLAERSSLPLLL